MTGFLNDILKNKALIYYLVTSELKAKYRSKILGFVWAVLDPLFLLGIYVFLIGFIFKRGSEQYPLLLFSVLISWRWFTYSLTTSAKVILSHSKIIQTVKFPVHLLVLSRVLISGFNYLISLAILIPLMFYYKSNFSMYLLWLPPLILFQFIFIAGISYIVAIVGVFFKDLQNIIEFAIRFLFYVSPALFDVDVIPEKFEQVYMLLNPFASLFVSLKNIIVFGVAPSLYIWVYIIFSIVILWVGLYLFNSRKFVKYL